MSNTPHTLHEEFPSDAQKISALKVSDAHFAKLLTEVCVMVPVLRVRQNCHHLPYKIRCDLLRVSHFLV